MAWSETMIPRRCSKVACSLEDADCACHRRGWDGEVVLLSSAGEITATYCSPAGAAAAHGITWQDAQRRCSSKALSKAKIESSTPPILRYATAWDAEIKRREAAKAAAEKRKVAQQAAAARSKDAAEAAAAAEAAMAALRKPAEWAQCSSCERWRLLPEGTSAASDAAWTCADVGVSCEKIQCSAEDPECECHAPGFDRAVVSVSPEGRVVETYCSPSGAGAATGMARSRAAECLNTRQVSKVNNVLRYAKDWAEEVRSRKAEIEAAEARPRVTCTLCRKVRVVPPGITIEDEEDWKCDDAPENWFAGASNTVVRRQRLSCETRECSTGMPHCPCQANMGRGVDQTREDGVIVRHCSIAACARALYPDAPDAELWKSNVVSCVEKGKPYAYDKDNDEKGGAFKGSKFSWARQDCAYCLSGANPETILLCDGWNCANEAHYHCAGLDAIPSGKWFCCEACEANPAPVARRAPNGGDGTRTTRCGECEGCLAEECGTCKFCLDKPSRGGKNTLRRPCVLRQCEAVLVNYDDTRRRWGSGLSGGASATQGGSGGGASATTDAPREEEESPGPGTRVWALFDDDSLCQSWWGGTIISISGVAEEMRYDVVFDDGERQGVYAAHVFHSPPDDPLPVSGPNAKAKALLEKALPKPKPRAPRKRPAPKQRPAAADAPPPRPQMPTGNCPVCYEPFSDDVKSFNCGHHLCGTCSEALARHKAEQGVNTTRQGVQVSCPLCRKRARV
jgi:hypothetical protein